MKERMKKVTALCLAAALSVGTVLPVHAETVQDAQNAVDQLQQQKDSVQAEKTTVETELKKISRRDGKDNSPSWMTKQAEITEAEENLVQAKVEVKYTVPEYEDPHQIYVREWKYGIY